MNFTPTQASQLVELYPSVLALEDSLDPANIKNILADVQQIMPEEDSVPSPSSIVATESIGGAIYSAYRWIINLFNSLFKWIVSLFGGKDEVITPNQIAQVHEKTEAQYEKKIHDTVGDAVEIFDGTIELPRMKGDSLIGSINETVLSMSKIFKDYAKYLKNVNKTIDELKEGFTTPLLGDSVIPKGDISRAMKASPKISEKVTLLGQFKGRTLEDIFMLSYTGNVSSLATKRYEVTWAGSKSILSEHTRSVIDRDTAAFISEYTSFMAKFNMINTMIKAKADNMVHPMVRASLVGLARISLNSTHMMRLTAHIKSLDRVIFLSAHGKTNEGIFTETLLYRELIVACNNLNANPSNVVSNEAIDSADNAVDIPDFRELKALLSDHKKAALDKRARALITLESNPKHVSGTWLYNLNADEDVSKTIRADNTLCDRMNIRLLSLVDKLHSAVSNNEDVDFDALVASTIKPTIDTTGLGKIRFSKKPDEFISYMPYGSIDLDMHTNLEIRPVDIMETNTPNIAIIENILTKLITIGSKINSAYNPQLEGPLRQISAYLYTCISKHVNSPYVFEGTNAIDEGSLKDKITFLELYGKHGNDVTFKFGQRISVSTADYTLSGNVDAYTGNMNKVNNLVYLICMYVHKDLIALNEAVLSYKSKPNRLTKVIESFGAKVLAVYDELPKGPIKMANVTVTFDAMLARETGKILTVSKAKHEHNHTNVGYIGGLTAPTQELRYELLHVYNQISDKLASIGSNMPLVTDVDHLGDVRKCVTEVTELLTDVKQILENVNVTTQDPYAQIQKAYCQSVTTRQK